jgi:hypothetical protein
VRSERERGRAGGASETDWVRVGSLNESQEEGLSENESRGAESVGIGGLNESDRVVRKVRAVRERVVVEERECEISAGRGDLSGDGGIVEASGRELE